MERPWRLILIGVVLSFLGVVFPFLMVIKVLESTFLLNFLSYGAQVAGLFLGIIGASQIVRRHRK
ncbi:MAG: hypothetical protein AB1649_06045 [Chloroflexota bacterium]